MTVNETLSAIQSETIIVDLRGYNVFIDFVNANPHVKRLIVLNGWVRGTLTRKEVEITLINCSTNSLKDPEGKIRHLERI